MKLAIHKVKEEIRRFGIHEIHKAAVKSHRWL